MEIPTLETPRLILRPFQEADFEPFAAMCADPEMMRFIGDGQPLSRHAAWRYLAMLVGHWHLRGYGLWAVTQRDTGQFVGRVGFFNPDGWPDFEVGWSVRRDCWNRGYATEAGLAALQFAFTSLHQCRVCSLIQPGNTASIRVAERIGERLAGTVDLFGREVLMYVISADEWQQCQPTSTNR